MCELPCGKKGTVNPGVWGTAGSRRQVPSSSGCCGLQPKMSTWYQELPKSSRFLTPSNQTPSISGQSTGLSDIPQFCYFAIFSPCKLQLGHRQAVWRESPSYDAAFSRGCSVKPKTLTPDSDNSQSTAGMTRISFPDADIVEATRKCSQCPAAFLNMTACSARSPKEWFS